MCSATSSKILQVFGPGPGATLERHDDGSRVRALRYGNRPVRRRLERRWHRGFAAAREQRTPDASADRRAIPRRPREPAARGHSTGARRDHRSSARPADRPLRRSPRPERRSAVSPPRVRDGALDSAGRDRLVRRARHAPRRSWIGPGGRTGPGPKPVRDHRAMPSRARGGGARSASIRRSRSRM